MFCQAYQQNQCAGNSCSMGAHICAMVVVIAAMIAARSSQQERRRDSKKNNIYRSQRSAWMTTGDQQLDRSRQL